VVALEAEIEPAAFHGLEGLLKAVLSGERAPGLTGPVD
jgi:hypothetical protein